MPVFLILFLNISSGIFMFYNSAFEQGDLDLRRYINAFIIKTIWDCYSQHQIFNVCHLLIIKLSKIERYQTNWNNYYNNA